METGRITGLVAGFEAGGAAFSSGEAAGAGDGLLFVTFSVFGAGAAAVAGGGVEVFPARFRCWPGRRAEALTPGFAAIRASVEMPCLRAMLKNVSPGWTLWPPVTAAGAAAVSRCAGWAAEPGTLSFCPIWMRAGFLMPFARARASGLEPTFRAIFARLSPARTV